MNPSVAGFRIAEEIGLARTNELVRLSFAVASAVTRDPAEFSAITSEGAALSTQCLATRRDEDGWIRQAVLIVPITVDAAGSSEISVEVNHTEAPTSAPAVAAGRVDAGARLQHSRFVATVGAAFVALEGREIGRRPLVSSIGLPDGSTAQARAQAATIEVRHEGPLYGEIAFSGDYVTQANEPTGWRFNAVITAAAAQASMTLKLQLVNAIGDSDESQLTRWDVGVGGENISAVTCGAFGAVYRGDVPATIRATGEGHARGVFAVAHLDGGTDWQFVGSEDYWGAWEWSELQGINPTNWVAAESEHPLTVAVQRFTENHPGEIRATADGVTVEFWPETAEPLALHEGSAKTMTIAISAGIDSAAGEILDLPLVAHPSSAAKRFDAYGVLAYAPESFPQLESHIREELFSWYQSGQSLGFHDYGDGVQGITTGPRTGYSANNEHDALLALVLHYVRSGERAYFESAKAYADHLLDIDRIHTSSRFPAEVGGMRAHGRAHLHRVSARTIDGEVRTSVDTGHLWAEGLIAFGQLTGDDRYLDAARGVGECILSLHELGWTRPQPGPRNAGWPLLALSSLARLDHDSRTIAAIGEISERAIDTQSTDGRWLMRLGRSQDYCAWQNAILISGLLRGATVTGDRSAREAALAGARAMITAGRNPDGTFVFLGRFDYRWANRSGLIREALALAYDEEPDEAFVRAGLKGGDRWYRPRAHAPALSNDVAEWRGHLLFLERAQRAGLLADMSGGEL